MRYGLRTLMIVVALAPPVLAGVWFALPRLAIIAALIAMLAIPAVLLYVWVEVI